MSENPSPAEVRVFTLFRARNDTLGEVEALCREIVQRASQEPTCVGAEFLRDAEEDGVYAVTVRSASIEDLEQYLQLAWRRELVERLLSLLTEEPERRLLEAVTTSAAMP
jgi:quinol monooxygenase YgiN